LNAVPDLSFSGTVFSLIGDTFLLNSDWSMNLDSWMNVVVAEFVFFNELRFMLG